MFRSRLAGYLGTTVADMEARISTKELNDWRIQEQVEPYGEKREDIRFALLCMFLGARFDELLSAVAQKRVNRRWTPDTAFPLIKKHVPTVDELARKLQVMFGDPELDDEYDSEAGG